jgi:hypothetical protein
MDAHHRTSPDARAMYLFGYFTICEVKFIADNMAEKIEIQLGAPGKAERSAFNFISIMILSCRVCGLLSPPPPPRPAPAPPIRHSTGVCTRWETTKQHRTLVFYSFTKSSAPAQTNNFCQGGRGFCGTVAARQWKQKQLGRNEVLITGKLTSLMKPFAWRHSVRVGSLDSLRVTTKLTFEVTKSLPLIC